MIIGIAVLLIVSFILAVGWRNEVNLNKQLKKEIAELKASNSCQLKPESEDERGSFIKQRRSRRPTARTYQLVFDIDPNGQRVIDHLQLVFANKSTYVRGGQEGDRESCFRAGQADVIGFIFKQINNANDPSYKEKINE